MNEHPTTILQDAEQAVYAVLEHTTRSHTQRDRRITHRLESAAASIRGALILLSDAEPLREDVGAGLA